MVTAAWDSSNLVALYKDGMQCTSCCAPPGGWGADDCGCFVAFPMGEATAWDSETEYFVGGIVIHGDIYYQCMYIPGHTNQEPPNTTYWASLAPYGGIGKVPGTITLNITGVLTCPTPPYSPVQDINGTWELVEYTHGGVGHLFSDCAFRLTTTINGRATYFEADLYNDFTYAEIRIQDVATSAQLYTTGPLNPCMFIWNGWDNVRQGCFPDGDWATYQGTASWRPGTIPAWDECDNYDVGDRVAHEGSFYVCILAHNAGSDCSGAKEPPDAMYWAVI